MADSEWPDARLARLFDEREIERVLALYGRYADHGEHEAFVQLFTEDAVIELVGGTPSGAHGDNPRWEGRERIREYMEDPTMHMKIEGRCMHLPALNLIVDVDGDEAEAESCSLVLLHEEGQTSIYGAGFTRWELVRTDTGWRIRRRVRVAIDALLGSSST